ncbi:MAG: terminase [Deltaproteobacteria bacterium]|nr:terminase [Deltaproteobacteria bacterium]
MEIALSKAQDDIFGDDSRFKVVVAGRRFGKTVLALCILLYQATIKPDSINWYTAPTYRQAKQIAWKMLQSFIPAGYLKSKNETDLSMTFLNNSVISLRGADNYDSLRGVGLDALVLDEYADMAAEVWTEVLRPSLSDKLGTALFIGTPAGFNHLYDLWIEAEGKPGWKAWQFTTKEGGNVPQEELEAARLDLDERTYKQEYEASFASLTGRVYYEFDRLLNVSMDLKDTGAELLIGMDFNINPMSAVIGVKAGNQFHVIDEIIIPNGNTELMCDAIHIRYPGRRVQVYPDPSGRARKTSSPVGQTDFSILAAHGFRVLSPNAAPLVVDRCNEVNAMLKNAAGDRRLLVHPKCKQLIKCLDGLTFKEDTSQPDKGMGLDHLPDALGYLIHYEYPIGRKMSRMAIVGI